MKRSRRRGIVGIIVAVMLISLLGIGSFASAQKITISMSVWGMAWEDFLYTDVIIPQFEKENPDVDVKFYRYENYWEKLTVLFAGGEAPDVMRNYVHAIGWHARVGIPAPLDDYIKGAEGIDLNDFFSIPFESMDYLDHIYMIPAGINSHNVLYYNKDLFDKAGAEYPNPNWTWDDLVAAGKKLTGGGRYGFLWAIPTYMFDTMVNNVGGTIWDESKERCVVDSPKAIEAVKMMQKWIFDDKIVPKVGPDQIRTSSYAMFMGGRLGMITEGGWACPAFKRDAPQLNFARTTIPRATSEMKPMNSAGGTGWIMNSTTKYPQEAWKLLAALVSHEGLLTYWRTTWVEIPAKKSVVEDPRFRDIIGIGEKVPGIKTEEEFNEKVQSLIDIVENGWFTEEYGGPYHNVYEPLLIPALGELIGLKRGDPEKILKKLAADVNTGIEKEKR